MNASYDLAGVQAKVKLVHRCELGSSDVLFDFSRSLDVTIHWYVVGSYSQARERELGRDQWRGTRPKVLVVKLRNPSQPDLALSVRQPRLSLSLFL